MSDKFFEKASDLLGAYYVFNDKAKTTGFVNDLASEGQERLRQLAYLIEKVKHLEEILIQINQKHGKALEKWVGYVRENNLDYSSLPQPDELRWTNEDRELFITSMFEMSLFTESFYYFAFRLRTIIRHLPGLESFEAKGVRDVRNKLIEHPDKDRDSQIFIRSFATGNQERGPVIKALRYGEQPNNFPDNGLYINAVEFETNLQKVLATYLQNQLDAL
jgi:hypothetical protein